MSFVGHHQERRLAELEAAVKMLDALLLIPDHVVQSCGSPAGIIESPSKGHIETSDFVPCREVVLSLEV